MAFNSYLKNNKIKLFLLGLFTFKISFFSKYYFKLLDYIKINIEKIILTNKDYYDSSIDIKEINYFTLESNKSLFIKILDIFIIYILPLLNNKINKIITILNKNNFFNFIKSNIIFYKFYISKLLLITTLGKNNKNIFFYLNLLRVFIVKRILLFEIIYKPIINSENGPISSIIHIYELINFLIRYIFNNYYKMKYIINNIYSNIIFFILLFNIIFLIEYIIINIKNKKIIYNN